MSSDEVTKIERKLEEQTNAFLAGLSKLGDRVSALEIQQARREGRESVMTGGNINWQKLAMSLAKSLGYGLGAAYLIAKALLG